VLEKPFVKNPNQPMQEYADYVAAKLGDRIKIDQHVRFQAGEAMSDAAAGS
jgi:translation elongation factor EF-Ts